MRSANQLAALCALINNANSIYDAYIPDFERLSTYHGMQALLYYYLHRQTGWYTWPDALRESLSAATHNAHARALLRERELQKVLDKLAANGVHPILMKGVPLGYSHYPSPALRPCGDTDMLIREQDRAIIDLILQQFGYACARFKAQLISYQDSYGRTGKLNMRHELDIHWKISNRQLFSNTLDYASAYARAIPLPQLSKHAMALCPVDALLMACLHRATHLQDEQEEPDRLIWFYDMHVLVQTMSTGEKREFLTLAREKKLCAVCTDALYWTRHYFQTQGATKLLESLANSQPNSEPSAQYFAISNTQALWLDWRALPDFKSRLKALYSALFPAPAYMQQRYGKINPLWLPYLYPYRWFKACSRLLKNLFQKGRTCL